MLFSPPLPPVRLGETNVTIGRHPDCEFNLRQDDVSRHHAEVRFEDGCHTLFDLGSTNGSFVNGEKVDGSRRLHPGDRIEIGDHTITFCQVSGSPAPEPDCDVRTVIFDRSGPAQVSSGFEGDLTEMPAAALFQLMEMNGSSGSLSVDGEDGLANVWFENGAPVHAETQKNVGFDAAISVVGLRAGRFRFTSEPVEVGATIQANVTELLLEACRLEDEASALE